MKRQNIKLWAAALALCGLSAFLWWQNSALEVTYLAVEAPVREGLRIVHLSDLHGAFFGFYQERLERAVRAQEPDVIVITGDFIDRRVDERATEILLEALTDIAPIYCVTGNHEELERRSDSGCYEALMEVFETSEAWLLRGEMVWLTEEISLTGADDIPFVGGLAAYPEYLNGLHENAQGEYRILLAHRPEFFGQYASAGFDLTFSGHAHGGQIRLPVVGGLYAPGQGTLPEYTAGLYEDETGRQMVVSRGLGNSVFPMRLFNRPEIGVIDIVGMKQGS